MMLSPLPHILKIFLLMSKHEEIIIKEPKIMQARQNYL